MRIRLALILCLLSLLACKTVTSTWTVPPSATPTTEPPTLTSTLTPSWTATLQAPTATPTLRKPTPTEVVPTSTLTPTPGTKEVQLSTSGQLQVFEALWNIVNKEYLYPDFNGLDWASLHTELHKKIQAGMSTEDFYRGMYELIRSLGDDHSTFFSPKQAESEAEQFKGSYDYTGIGIFHVLIPERNLVSIVAVFPGSPAEQAGLHIHDNILEVNGKPILDANNLRTGDILGPPGTQLTLTVQTAGGLPRQILLEREKINAELPLPNWTMQSPQGKRIGYILLPTFNDETIGEQFKSVLKSMESEQKLDGLILDNRVNSGGADSVAYAVLSNFTKGTLGAFVGRNKEKPVRIVGNDLLGSQTIPLVVLVGDQTVSFGEIFTGILQDEQRAYVIGDTTGGNVELLAVYSFRDGSVLWIAQDKFRPAHHPDWDWEKTGILPDLQVHTEWDQISMDNDPAVDAALQHFDQQ